MKSTLHKAAIGLRSLIPRPLPPRERPSTHRLYVCKIVFCKSFVHLSCLYAEDYTNQEYVVAKLTLKQKGKKSICQKHIGSNRIETLCTELVPASSWTLLALMAHENQPFRSYSLTHLCETNMQGLYMYLMYSKWNFTKTSHNHTQWVPDSKVGSLCLRNKWIYLPWP